MIKIKSAAKVREEEEALRRAQQACAERPRTTDTTDYYTAMSAFKECALDIRHYINANYPQLIKLYPNLATFRAAFEEIAILTEFLQDQDDMRLMKKMLRVQNYDTAMEYEAEKLCIKTPASWYAAWSDELGPYEGGGTNVNALTNTPV